MTDRHRNPAITFRPPPEDRDWLTDYAHRTGRAVNAILTEALSQYRRRIRRRYGHGQQFPRRGNS